MKTSHRNLAKKILAKTLTNLLVLMAMLGQRPEIILLRREIAKKNYKKILTW